MPAWWEKNHLPSNARDYNLVSSTEDEPESSEEHNSSSSLKILILTAIANILILGSVLLLTHTIRNFGQEMSNISDIQIQNCGSSAEEAKALGCQFDPMTFSWVPPACYDAELSDEFMSIRDWKWTLDEAGDDEISLEEVLEGQYEQLYTSWEYHFLQCTYMWRKMHRAYLMKKPLDGYIANYNHTSHCEKILVPSKDIKINAVNKAIERKFVTC